MNSKSLTLPLPIQGGLGKALVIGFAAGLVASGVKTICEKIAPPRPPGVPSPLGNALDAASIGITGHPMSDEAKAVAEPVVHFLFGAGAGAVYAMIERKVPPVRAGYGLLFGLSFWLFAHEITLPAMGLSPTPAQMSAWEQGNEFVSHGIFGLAVEFVRRWLWRWWA